MTRERDDVVLLPAAKRGKDMRTLSITATRSVYTVKMPVAGFRSGTFKPTEAAAEGREVTRQPPSLAVVGE